MERFTETKITVVGSSNMDMVVTADRIPEPGETVLGGSFFSCPGGKGANQAVAIARLGGQVAFVTKLGADVFGYQLKTSFAKEGIHTDHVFLDEDSPSGIALIVVNKEGENSIVVAPGSNFKLGKEEIGRASHSIAQSEFILMQLEIPLETVGEVLRLADACGKKVVLNPAPACALPEDFYKGLFAITPNRSEAELLTGIRITDDSSCLTAAGILRRRGVKNIIITLGRDGAFLYSDAYTGKIEAPQVEAVDTTGAGDAFNGALAVALSEGRNIHAAAQFATQIAAFSVTRTGAQAVEASMKELLIDEAIL